MSISRLIYVRNASGLLVDNANLLHVIIIIFVGIWFTRRVFMWPVMELWTGRNFEKTPVGKFCMKTNVSLTVDDEWDEEFNQTSTKFALSVLVSMFIFIIALTYACLAALKER